MWYLHFSFIASSSILFLSQIFTYETDCLERDAASKIAYMLKFSILFAWTSTTFMSINGILQTGTCLFLSGCLGQAAKTEKTPKNFQLVEEGFIETLLSR